MRFQNTKFFLPAIFVFALAYLFTAYALPLLKYYGIITWSWWWISLPWWGGCVMAGIAFFVKYWNYRHISDALSAITLKSYAVGYCTRQGHTNPFNNPSGEIKTEAFHCVSTRNGFCTFKWQDLEIYWNVHSPRKVSTNRKMGKKEYLIMSRECLESLVEK